MKMFGFFFMLFGFFIFLLGVKFVDNSLVYYLEFVIMKFYGLDLTLSFIMDWMTLLYLSVVMYISGSIFIFSSIYLEKEVLFRFGIILFFFVLSMLVLVLSGDFFMMFLGWDGLGVTSFLLVGFYQNYRSLNCGMITFVSNRIGDVFMILVISSFFFMGNWSMVVSGKFNFFFLMLFFFASITKSAQFPFSAWLPAAMAAPTPVSALVHSSTLVTAGVYILCRISYFGYMESSKALMFVSLLTLFFSSLMACFEFDVKKVIALSTLSQLGLMMFSISLGLWKLGYFHMIVHAIFKSMLFLCGGSMIHFLLHMQDMRFYGSLKLNSFLIKVGFVVSLLSLCGFPFMSGFYSKDLIMEMYFMGSISFFVLLVFFFSMCLTVVYSLRLLGLCFNIVCCFPSFYSFFEDKFMNLSVFFLLIWGVIGGSTLFFILFSYEEVVFLGEFKLVGLYVIFFGVIFYLVWLNGMNLIWGKVFDLYSDFFYLFSLSLNLNLSLFYYFGFFDKMDKVWMEGVGPKGMLNIFWIFSIIMNYFVDLFLLILMVVLFFVLLF